jgi:large subunit ribosomal protein L1
VKEVKAGKIDFKVDKYGIVHASVGKVSFSPDKLLDNVQEVINTVARLKPASAKGTYFRTIHLSSTMSPGVTIDKNTVSGI